MSSSPQTVRQRGPKDKKRPVTPNETAINGKVEDAWESLKETTKDAAKSEWDYKIAFAVITALGFLTRFWGISHPNQVVFDEVHFGKVGKVGLREWT
jgi:dolichyl-phosphate-mannose-protein mannosyltransferase